MWWHVCFRMTANQAVLLSCYESLSASGNQGCLILPLCTQPVDCGLAAECRRQHYLLLRRQCLMSFSPSLLSEAGWNHLNRMLLKPKWLLPSPRRGKNAAHWSSWQSHLHLFLPHHQHHWKVLYSCLCLWGKKVNASLA